PRKHLLRELLCLREVYRFFNHRLLSGPACLRGGRHAFSGKLPASSEIRLPGTIDAMRLDRPAIDQAFRGYSIDAQAIGKIYAVDEGQCVLLYPSFPLNPQVLLIDHASLLERRRR